MVVIPEKSADGSARHTRHTEGKILNTAKTIFEARNDQDGGMETILAAGGTVERRRETKGVYDAAHRLRRQTSGNGYEFEKGSGFTDVPSPYAVV